MTTGNTPWLWIITGAVTAFIVGYISIKVLVAVTSRGKLKYFSYYLFILAFLTLIFYI